MTEGTPILQKPAPVISKNSFSEKMEEEK